MPSDVHSEPSVLQGSGTSDSDPPLGKGETEQDHALETDETYASSGATLGLDTKAPMVVPEDWLDEPTLLG